MKLTFNPCVAVLMWSAVFAAVAAARVEVDHGIYTGVLRAHVRGGHVDYAALCHDDRLTDYLTALSATIPDSLADDSSRLAFWLNAYNAFTLKAICDDYPVGSINDLHFGGLVVGTALNKTVWDRKFVVINGEKLSLNDIEHEIIRKRFGDPRIHFALVCAAKSCPPLRSEAYVAGRLDEQLAEQARLFFRDVTKNRFDVDAKVAHLSKILDWYGDDFGSDRAERLMTIAPYLPAEVAAAIRRDPESWRISHVEYDWSLNE